MSKLFQLPAELRNQIYEYALKEDHEIRIEDSKPPEWINTCKQFRHETLKMYYRVNTFYANIDHLDARKLVRWYTHVAAIFPDPMYTACLSSSHNWENLIEWCKEVWRGAIPGLSWPVFGAGAAGTCTVVVAAHNIADDYGDLSWERCLWALDNLREVLKVYDDGWGSSQISP